MSVDGTEVPTERGPFRHGVASFDPSDRSVLLWTRLSGGSGAAGWELAADDRFDEVVASGRATTGPDRDYTVVVDAEGLEPATTYWYRFTAADARSPVGRTRTLPAGPTPRVRLGLVSCAHYAVAPLGVYRALAEREVDLVVHLGDYMYEEEHGGPRSHRPPRTAVSLADYRSRLAQLREDPDLQALHLRHPMALIWDDHDLSDNAWRDGAKKHDPEEHGPWEARVGNAARARQEWVPGRLRDPDDPLTIWRSLELGDLARLALLDTRYAGRDLQAGDEGAKELHDPDRSLLGDRQRAWLETELATADQPWVLVASGVVVNEIALPMPVGQRVNVLLPNGYSVFDGKVLHDDQWDGYPAERERLAGWLEARGGPGRHTVLLSGDVHSSWAFEGPRAPGGDDPVGVEFTCPAVSSAAMARAHYPGAEHAIDRAVAKMEHVRFSDVTDRGYVVVDLTRDELRAEWWFVRPYHDDPASSARMAVSFAVRGGEWPPRLHAVDEPTGDPARPGLPGPLPPRPADLPALKRHHAYRVVRDVATAGGTLLVPVAVAAALWRRLRGR